MPINSNDIEVGSLYKTLNSQNRLVIGFNADDKVIYSAVGSKYKIDQFSNFVSAEKDRFANACSKRVEKLEDNDFLKVKDLFFSRNIAQMALKG